MNVQEGLLELFFSSIEIKKNSIFIALIIIDKNYVHVRMYVYACTVYLVRYHSISAIDHASIEGVVWD